MKRGAAVFLAFVFTFPCLQVVAEDAGKAAQPPSGQQRGGTPAK